MPKMRYSVPALLALRLNEDVPCKWTSEATHCKSKPGLSENRPNRSNNDAANVLTKSSAKLKAKLRSRAAQGSKNKPSVLSNPSLTTTDTGFAQFLQKHSSPTHQRVTAGGKIVPMMPPTPRLEGGSPVLKVFMSEDPSVVGRVFLDDRLVADNSTDGPYESFPEFINIASFDEGEIRFHPVTPQSLEPMREVEPARRHPRFPIRVRRTHFTEDVPLRQAPDTPAFVPDPEQAPSVQIGYSGSSASQFEWYDEGRAERWFTWGYEIQKEEAAMQAAMIQIRHLDIWAGVDFYRRYVRCAWSCNIRYFQEAEVRLRHKLSLHEEWLADVNEAIALDPWSRPQGRSLYYRIYNTNERARMLTSLEELEGIQGTRGGLNEFGLTTYENIASTFGSYSAVQDDSNVTVGSREDALTTDGVNDVLVRSHARASGPVRIIDPHTGCPIDLIGLSQNPKNRAAKKNGQAHGVADKSIGVKAGPSIAAESEDTSLEIAQSPEHVVKELTDRVDDALLVEHDQLPSWIPQEMLDDLRSVRKKGFSKTVPRNFGRPRYGPGLQTITEVDSESFSHDDNEHAPGLLAGRTVSSPMIKSKREDHDVSVINEILSERNVESGRNKVKAGRENMDPETKQSDDDHSHIQDREIAGSSIEGSRPSQHLRTQSSSGPAVIHANTHNTDLQFDLEDLECSCTSEMPLLSNPSPSPTSRPRLPHQRSDPTVLSSLSTNLHAPHTTPAIVLTDMTNVYGSFAKRQGT
ncbi:uncharacterized protein N7511_009076 [Penicillium nucicola]|uniref:uncharacterized protein n=1 Tax=Penicillium nucicola TaxID=1850975 RepID=UPI0025457960|nr:uncharacterized protein N7511_009076 [Penicillium nucicola]KAJ5747380.1 hypothetical protein N7511_009076 [Penicillium nucicola]